MFIKYPQQKLQTRSISNASGHSNGRMYVMPQMQNNTINAIWDINQIGQELDCHDDPILNEALDLITNRQVNQAILLLNQMIADGKKYLGQQSQVQVITKVTLLIVSSAMTILENDPASALLLLLGCDQMFKGLTPKQQGYLRVQILNGLGCYYRRVGQLEKALKELECALAVIRKYNLKEVAVTHLNLSVVLSLVEEHEGALENAKKAVTESHKEYQYYIKNHVSMQNFKFQRCVSALAISFYNVGVQEQHFQKYQFALQAYASAFKVAEDNLGIQHYLTIQLKAIYEEFARQLAIAEAQKIAITSLNHKFQIKANVTSQYAQSVLRNQNTETTKKITERLFQTETKRLGHSLRPQSAIMSQTQPQKIKAFEINKKEAFTIKKQMSATNRTLNQLSEENLKTDSEIAEKAKALQNNIENLRTLAQKEQEELKQIQDQKQRELQKLEAFRYMNQQIQQHKLQKNTPQTSRDIRKSSEQQKQIFNTDPYIQEQLDDSEPQPLVAVQIMNNKESKTDIEEEQFLSNEKMNDKQLKNEINQDYDKKRSSMTQDETLQSFTKKLDYDQESSSKNNFGLQNLSCKQIDDLEEIVEDINEQQNQKIVENKVEQIISQAAQKLNEEQKLKHVILIQTIWKSSVIKLKQRIFKQRSKYQQSIDHHYIKIKDQNELIHNGYIFIAWNQNELTKIDLIFYDLYTLRKSTRKSNDISQKLDHIFILNLSSTFFVNNDLIIQIEDEILPFLKINYSELLFSSIDPYIQFKQKNSENQIRLDFILLQLGYVLPNQEEKPLNFSTPVTLADIQQFNSDSMVIHKAAYTTPDQLFSKVEPFQDVPLVQKQIEEEEEDIQYNQRSQAESVKQQPNEEVQNSEKQIEKENSIDEKIYQTGQFNNIFSSQAILFENEEDVQKQKQNQQSELNQNADFTLQLNQISANNSMVGSLNIVETENQNQQQSILQNNGLNGNQEKVSANNTIIEEDEEEKKEFEINEANSQENTQQDKQVFNAKYSLISKNEISQNNLEIGEKSDQQSQQSQSQIDSQTSIEQKHQTQTQTQTLAIPSDENKIYAKQVSLQLPDLMKDDISQHSDEEISLTNNYTFEKVGFITGINKNDGSLIQINIFINKEQELFQAKAEDFKVKSTYFKVENMKKTLKKPQKYLKGYIVNWQKENILKVYTKAHEKAVIKLQKKFKFDHYRRHITFKLAKSNIEGSLYVGSRKQVIFLAIETKSTLQRNSYTFRNEIYSQFVNRISFRVLNNLKYSEEKGIYLLQEPEHRILAQNLQSKIFKLLKPENAFEFIGFGLLNGIYDSVHKKIIIASDNRKTQPSQIDIPKSIQGDQLVQFAQNLLNRSFIIQSNNETCVVYYEEKDEDQVKIIQNKIFNYQTIRKMVINYKRIYNSKIEQQEFQVELQRKLKNYFAILFQNKFYLIGKLKEQQIKNLITNFRRIISTFIIYQSDQVELDLQSIKEFVNDGQFTNLLRMDLKSVVQQI